MSKAEKQIAYLERLATGRIVRIGQLTPQGGYAVKVEGEKEADHTTGQSLSEAIDAAQVRFPL